MLPESMGLLIEGGSEKSRRAYVEKHLAPLPPFDIHLVGGGEDASIGIEAIRIMKRAISIKHERRYVVVIHEAQWLTIPAQNALLKTLEEPPKNVHFLLTVPHHNRLLPTIQSRLMNQIIENQKIETSAFLLKGSAESWYAVSEQWAGSLRAVLPKVLSETRVNMRQSIQKNESSKQTAIKIRSVLRAMADERHNVQKKLLAATLLFDLEWYNIENTHHERV